jgi:predicted aldo/keto reductase-like oxidoreductase
MGINYFDTARIYSQGNSERLMGVGLKGRRDGVVLVSKTIAKTRADALADLETSLKELQTDHLDVWYLHARDTPDAIPAELVEAQELAKKQGKARFIGVSTHDPAAIVDHVLKTGKHDVVFFTYNFSMGTSRDAAIARFKAANVGLVAMKVTTPSGGPGGGDGGRGRGAAAVPPRKPGAHAAALKWALKNPAIASCVVTMMNTDVLEENFRAASEKMRPEEENLLALVNEDIRPAYCRMCYGCKDQCPQGIPVTNVLRYLAYSDFNGDFPMGRQNFLELPEKVRQVRCGDCQSCSVECPNGVRVRERLIRAQEIFA